MYAQRQNQSAPRSNNRRTPYARPPVRARVGLLMDHAVQHRQRREVPDPYYGSDADFRLVLDLVEDACDGLVKDLGRELAGLNQAGKA